MSFDSKKFDLKLFKVWSLAKIRKVAKEMLLFIGNLQQENQELRGKVEDLQNQLKILKGEKPNPKFAPSKDKSKKDKDKDDDNTGTGAARGKRGARNHKVQIDEERVVDVDKKELPPDAQFKGYREVVIQNITLKTHNIKFKLCRYFSSALGIYFDAQVPAPFKGSEFGPELRALVTMLYYQGRVTENKIHKILSEMGIYISAGYINTLLLSSSADFARECQEVKEAGLKKGVAQIDDTGARVMGMNGFTTVVCNELFSSFHTSFYKNRLNVLQALSCKKRPLFILNSQALEHLEKEGGVKRVVALLRHHIGEKIYSLAELNRTLLSLPLIARAGPRIHYKIKLAMGKAAYLKGLLGPVPRALVSDDAPQFKGISHTHQLCWVHELRHYKTLEVPNVHFKNDLDEVLGKLQGVYRQLREHAGKCGPERYVEIYVKLKDLCQEKTGYKAIDELLEQTHRKIPGLLMSLKQESIPVHNNECERDIREKVIKRKVSLCHRSMKGARASDVFLSLLKTCQKLDINFWSYLKDRFNQTYEILPLKKIIESRDLSPYPSSF